MQTYSAFFKAASPFSLFWTAESQAELQILHNNLKTMAGQPHVGVLNLTLWSVCAGLTALSACPSHGYGSRTGSECPVFLASKHMFASWRVLLGVSVRENRQLSLRFSFKEESLYFLLLDLISHGKIMH